MILRAIIAAALSAFIALPAQAQVPGLICDNDDAKAAANADALQAAIDSYPLNIGGCIDLTKNGSLCRFNKPLIWKNGLHLCFRGNAIKATSPWSGTSLIYTGTASPTLDFRSSPGVLFEGVTIWAANDAFNGIILDCGSDGVHGSSSYCQLVNSNLMGNGVNSPTCLNLNNAIEPTVDRVAFTACDVGIQLAWNAVDVNVATRITNAKFFDSKTIPIRGCGDRLTIDGDTVFEPLRVPAGSPPGTLGHPGAMITSPNWRCQTLAIRDIWAGDADNNGTWFTLYGDGADIKTNRIGNGTPFYLPDYNGFVFETNTFDASGSIVCGPTSIYGRIGINTYRGATPQPTAPCPIANGGAPVVADFTGAITSQNGNYAAATWGGRYWKFDKFAMIQGKADVTDVGSVPNTAWLQVTLPFAAAAVWQEGGYYEGAVSSKSGSCILIPNFPSSGTTQLECRRADGSSPTANGPSTLGISIGLILP